MANETPAARAMRLLGAKRIAAALDLTTNAVWKWETTGGGRIPSKHQSAILELAKAKGVELAAADVVGVS